ncbi:MAG: TSUP family transporter, partial [Hydrogenoanaerobacterium sp.]
MENYAVTLLIVCPLVFLAGFIDSIAGGGGIISLPAYIYAGIPIHLVYGTNKFGSTFGTLIAAGKYAQSGYVEYRSAASSVVGAIIGAWGGAKLVVFLDEEVLKYCMLIILPLVAIFLLFNRGFGRERPEKKKTGAQLYVMAFGIGFAIGVYDGFFGPGTGTFLTLAFTGLLGFSLINASGNAKVVNLASNAAALAVYIKSGNVIYAVGIPAAICGICGNYLGARLAIKKGERFIRPIIILSVALLFIHMIIEIFG